MNIYFELKHESGEDRAFWGAFKLQPHATAEAGDASGGTQHESDEEGAFWEALKVQPNAIAEAVGKNAATAKAAATATATNPATATAASTAISQATVTATKTAAQLRTCCRINGRPQNFHEVINSFQDLDLHCKYKS